MLAVVFTSFNWLTFTASVKARPLATPAMTLPPLFRPALVRVTGPVVEPVGGVIVTPLPLSTVVLPAASVDVTLLAVRLLFSE